MYSEFDLELGVARVEAERDTAIATARQQLARHGREACECGATISPLRREKFGAVRCIDCQNAVEKEAMLK